MVKNPKIRDGLKTINDREGINTMTHEDIKQKIINLIGEKGKVEEGKEVNLDAPINAYLNSITYVQFLIAVEAEFDMEFDDSELDIVNFPNFSSLVDFVYGRLNS